jgi:quinol monooxygenase YgiN
MLNRSFVAVFALFAAACSSSTASQGNPAATADAGEALGADSAAPAADAGPGAPVPAAVLILGTLADADLGAAQTKQDQAAKGGEGTAKQLGDTAHTVMLGTSLLGTTKNQFLALDRWSDKTNIDAFYANKDLQASFAQIFSAAPAVTVYVAQPGWSTYGTPDGANGSDPHYWVIVRGKMKSADLAQNQATHDGVAAQAAPKAKAAGDVAHVVYTGRDEAQQFLAVDVWPDATNIAAFYGNPDVQAAFGQLFEGAPTIGIYESTQWYQW